MNNKNVQLIIENHTMRMTRLRRNTLSLRLYKLYRLPLQFYYPQLTIYLIIIIKASEEVDAFVDDVVEGVDFEVVKRLEGVGAGGSEAVEDSAGLVES